MRGDKKYSGRVRISESMKVRVQAYALKHDCSESEVFRRAIKKFLQSNVTIAKQALSK